ncbi:MAG TPA: MotA/TolQ/ExbB proton channel family protein [Thiolinea sp.]|nr:MotA/TolQ/ExbB proton channel family protein [Thiolinea sp.]
MFPIILCSVIAMAIIIERFLALRNSKVISPEDVNLARKMASEGSVNEQAIERLRSGSIIGNVLAAGLSGSSLPRHIMKENVEEAGRHAVHRMERYLNTLGTIAAITPLMGLLGTVLGMITAFSKITQVGVGDPATVAGGISQALVTTAAGISVALVALVFHRYFKGRVDNYVVSMEQQAVKLIELVHQNNQNQIQAAARPAARQPGNGNLSRAEAAIAAAKRRAGVQA